ncbi:MAG: hypothetical protein WBL06_12075 [Pseudolysinimonas sp.]|uniref:hypothetical protein n=1 Tax=Pseudolysinimonas sp. TaxID=2680009 RepID=UPI003C75A5AC
MTSVAERLVRIAASLLPPLARDRYREEWLADLAGADEAGVAPSGVVVGAFATAATMSRTAPELSGLTLDRLFAHRLRIAGALLGGAAVLATGYSAYGGYRQPSMDGAAVVAVIGGIALAVAIVLGLAGLMALGGALAVALEARRYGIVGMLVATLLLVIVVLVAMPFVLAVTAVLAGPFVLITVAVLIVLFSAGRRIDSVGTRVALAAAFGLLAAAACGIGILHIAIWNPLAPVPGLTLDEIYAGLAAANEAPGFGAWLVAWAVIVGVLAVGFVVVAVVWRGATTRRLVAGGFLLLAGTTAIGYLPAFSMGMGLADTFMTTGGDAAATGPLLGILGQVALVGSLLVAFVRPPLRQRVPLVVART